MSAVCPACGVAVVPGYVRCPKCHVGLPQRSKRTTADPGGTAVVPKGFPLSAVLVAVGVAAAIIVVFGFHTANKQTEAAPALPPGPIAAVPATPAPRPPIAAPPAPAPAPAAAEPAPRDPRAVTAELEDVLHRQRLWGRVQIAGTRIDVRSGSCSDKAMRPTIEAQRSMLHGAGLTRLRCVEQSGAVVFERDL